MNHHILLTGASGFIGSNIARALLQKKIKTTLLVRDRNAVAALEGCSVLQMPSTTRELVELLKQNKSVPYTHCVHLASLFIAEHQVGDIESLVNSNILFGTQVLEASSVLGIGYFVNTGTTWQHQLDSPEYHPACLYAASKEAFEKVLDYYTESKKMTAISLKIFDSYGPNDSRKKLVKLLIDSMPTTPGQAPLPMSPGEQEIDLIHVNDIVEAYLRAIEFVTEIPLGSHFRFSLGSGSPITVKNLVNLMETSLGSRPNVALGMRPYRANEVMKAWRFGKTLPGWTPKTSLEEGLKALGPIAWPR